MDYYISDPGLQKAGEMLLEDLRVLEQMINDLEVLLEESPRLSSFANELAELIDIEIKYRRKMVLEIAEAHIH